MLRTFERIWFGVSDRITPPPRGLDDGFAPRAELRGISERFTDAQMHFPNPIRMPGSWRQQFVCLGGGLTV